MTAAAVRRALRCEATEARAIASQRYFRTGPGEYGEGDVFLGVTMPAQRVVARTFAALPLAQTLTLLRSKVHEERMTALLILVGQFRGADARVRAEIVRAYLANTRFVNNWDLVDTSAPQLLGAWLLDRDRKALRKLARSPSLWERRIAMLSTQAFIAKGEHEDALALAALLLGDEHDLMHKAVGWMLREVGEHIDPELLRAFLREHAPDMPRTALRYAIEHFDAEERALWLAVKQRKRG